MRAAAMALFFLVGATAVAAPPMPAPAAVPEPRSITVVDLPQPAGWAHELGFGSPHLDFRVDLDLIAPLGTGRANAADYFRAFASGGSRAAEIEAARERRVDVRGDPVLPPDDPLLLEAEPWADQARMRFYPNVWRLNGFRNPLPNLAQMSLLARSWVARGQARGDRLLARRDFRRAIRLGRLLRQDDISTLQDIAGLMLIRLGLNALYDDAKATSDATQAALLALAIHDHEALRMESSRRRDLLRSTELVHDGPFSFFTGPSGELADQQVEQIRSLTGAAMDRRFRIDAIRALCIIRNTGTSRQERAASATIAALRSDGDPFVAEMARWAANAPLVRGVVRPRTR